MANAPRNPNPRRIEAKMPAALTNGQPNLPIPEEAKAQVGQFIQLLMEKLKPQHEPVLNSLKKLGVSVKMRDVGGEQCFCINVTELMTKEYAFMSGVNLAEYEGNDD